MKTPVQYPTPIPPRVDFRTLEAMPISHKVMRLVELAVIMEERWQAMTRNDDGSIPESAHEAIQEHMTAKSDFWDVKESLARAYYRTLNKTEAKKAVDNDTAMVKAIRAWIRGGE